MTERIIMKKAVLFFDGGGENPGFMKMSICMKIHGEEGIVYNWSDTGQYGTNNQAEWLALIWGIMEAKRQGVTHLQIYGDSQVIVFCAAGVWNSKKPHLKELQKMYCDELYGSGMDVKIDWIRRENNVAGWQISDKPVDLRNFEKWKSSHTSKNSYVSVVTGKYPANFSESSRKDYTKEKYLP